MFGNAVRVARMAGIDIRVRATWLLIAALIGWTFFLRFEFLYDELQRGEAIGLAATATVIFFMSILLHELERGPRVLLSYWPSNKRR